MKDRGVDACWDAENRGSVPTARENLISIDVPYIIDTALFRVVQVGSCLSHDVNVFKRN